MDPEEIVRKAEAAYTAQAVDRIMELFDPAAVVYWNGQKVAEGVKYHGRGGPWRSRLSSPREGQRNGPCETLIPSALPSTAVVWNQRRPNRTGPWRSAALLRPTPPGAPRLTPRWVRGFCEVVNGGSHTNTRSKPPRSFRASPPPTVGRGTRAAFRLEEVRQFHEEGGETEELEVRKTLRAASGDTIAVEWKATGLDSDGTRFEQYGGEFWTMRDGRLREWHAYDEVYEHDETEDRKDEEYISHH